MKSSLQLSSSITWIFLMVSIAVIAERPFSADTRLIDIHGMRIPSVFYGISPRPSAAFEHSRIMKASGAMNSTRNTRDAIYRESDGLARFLKIQGLCRDVHYQVEYVRNCGSFCGGGDENWTYTDSLLASWCDQYQIDFQGCLTQNCSEDSWCSDCL